MSEPQSTPPRVRLQELLAIPDSQRTNAQWDELNELEIMLASGNSGGAPEQSVRRSATAPVDHSRPNGGARRAKQVKKFQRRGR